MAPQPPPESTRDSEGEGPWQSLDREFDLWATAERCATLWWRDDDAAQVTPALTQLVDLSARTTAPLALAVIPEPMSDSLPASLTAAPQITVIQHGYAHINHARQKGQGAWELGAHRSPATVLGELATGFRRLADAFDARFVPFVVPPWNRIDDTITRGLPDVGLRGLSTFGPRAAPSPAPGVVQVNAHCDPIKWKGGARFTGTARALDDVIDHLRDRRLGRVDADEPTGLLTHHLDLDAACWQFVEQLLVRVDRHPAARWLSVAEILNTGQA